MASGFGLTGNTGRCYPLWVDFSECISKTDNPNKCVDIRDDYLECLHHRKEFTRLNLLQREYHRQVEEAEAKGKAIGKT
ncbi:hypothetical protein BSKO_00426 [Bryopsis sp. KO-2023]|nr:hypothetical protein BSKO_00426 [Bryopsis sp. KO-2023]